MVKLYRLARLQSVRARRHCAIRTIAATGASICVLAACAVNSRGAATGDSIGRSAVTWVAIRTPDTTPTPAARATAAAATPGVAPGEASPSLPATSTPAPLVRYRGHGPYHDGAMFDISYDQAIWEYVDDDGRGHPALLRHRHLAGCALWLRAGPIGVDKANHAQIGTRSWHVGQLGNSARIYWSDDLNPYVLSLLLPDVRDSDSKARCSNDAETVIATFRAFRE